jgi:NADH-quinone oxidoreductase subunit J
VAITLAVVLFLEAGYWLIVRSPLSGALTHPPAALNDTSAVKEMSAMLFNQYLLPFEVTSILLLAAMVGAILLTLREKPKKEGGT